MEYLSGEWLFESWYMKEHRCKWYLHAAIFEKNDKCAVVPIMVISYEWNMQVSLDIFCLLKILMTLWEGEGGSRSVSHISFFCFPLKLKIPQYEKSSEELSCLG